MNIKSKHRSFTLIELLLVIGVIIILAGISVFNFSKAKERALTKEAIANLKLIAAAEKVYRMENGFYYPSTGSETDITQINDNLKLYFTDETNWDYVIDIDLLATPDNFTATAQRKGAGPYSTCKFTLTYNDTDGEPNPSGTCP